MKITIDVEDLVEILNNAIAYGGDSGGPYHTESAKVDLINNFKKQNIEIVFEEYGDIYLLRNYKNI